jgi:hypothetical protein
MFENIGKQFDNITSWLFKFENNDIQLLFWSGLIGALLVFLIEYLRRPKINITLLDCSFDFNLQNDNSYLSSKNWKIRVEYNKSILNKLLFRYPISNLKMTAKLSSLDGRFNKEYALKADNNPNAYEEKDIPVTLSKINLSKEEFELYPFINKSSDGWIPFEVWSIFLPHPPREQLDIGAYLLSIKASSDQINQQSSFKIFIDNNDLKLL